MLSRNKNPLDLEFELSREPLEIDQICQLQNWVPREMNNLLIEYSTEGCLDLELQWLI